MARAAGPEALPDRGQFAPAVTAAETSLAQKVFSSSPAGRQDQSLRPRTLTTPPILRMTSMPSLMTNDDAELEEDAELKDDVDDLEDDPEFTKETERAGERADSASGAAGGVGNAWLSKEAKLASI